MRKSKIFIAFIIFVLTGVGLYVTYLLASEEYEIKTDTATVVSRRNAGSVIVDLSSEEELKNELLVYTNIFTNGDTIKVDYSKINREYKVVKVYNINENKNLIASRIQNDPTVIKYSNKIRGKTNIEENININNIVAIPIKIDYQEFELLKEEEYYNIMFKDNDVTNIQKDSPVTLNLLDDFEVVGVQNIEEDMRTELLYSITDKNISFTGVGKGIYSVKLKFKNGDIINYIFS